MGKKILVADDDENFVKFVTFNLEENGYETISADNGVDAFDKALNELPDLILLDIMMPLADGYSTMLKLKKSYKTKDIPVIIITAKSEIKDICKTHGAQDYIVKPIAFKEIMDKIKRLLPE